MTKFVLVKKKGVKKWKGVFSIKCGSNPKVIKDQLSALRKQGFQTKIVNKCQLKNLIHKRFCS